MMKESAILSRDFNFSQKDHFGRRGKVLSKLVCWTTTSVECSGRSSSANPQTCQAAQPHSSAPTVQAGEIREPVGGSLCKYDGHTELYVLLIKIYAGNSFERGGEKMSVIYRAWIASQDEVKVFHWLNFPGWPQFPRINVCRNPFPRTHILTSIGISLVFSFICYSSPLQEPGILPGFICEYRGCLAGSVWNQQTMQLTTFKNKSMKDLFFSLKLHDFTFPSYFIFQSTEYSHNNLSNITYIQHLYVDQWVEILK